MLCAEGYLRLGALSIPDYYVTGEVPTTEVAKRARESPYPLVNVDEAVSTVLQHAPVLNTITVQLTGTVYCLLCLHCVWWFSDDFDLGGDVAHW